VRPLTVTLTPGGAGADRVLASWSQLARHAATPCEPCLQVVLKHERSNSVPPQLLDACCEAGQPLVRAWIEACVDLVDHLIALS
jgi:hypothetical protein